MLGGLGLEVPSDEELHEQEQVASVHDKGGRVVFALELARAFLVSRVEVEGRECHGHTDNHLRNLERCDVHWIEPLGSELDGHEEIVEVHAGMDGVVHDDEKDSRWACRHVRMPAVQKDRDVMIPVKEDELLFVDDNEERVKKLTVGTSVCRFVCWFGRSKVHVRP